MFISEEVKNFPIDSRAVFIEKEVKDKALKEGTIKWTGRHRVSYDGATAAVIVLVSSNFVLFCFYKLGN